MLKRKTKYNNYLYAKVKKKDKEPLYIDINTHLDMGALSISLGDDFDTILIDSEILKLESCKLQAEILADMYERDKLLPLNRKQLLDTIQKRGEHALQMYRKTNADDYKHSRQYLLENHDTESYVELQQILQDFRFCNPNRN